MGPHTFRSRSHKKLNNSKFAKELETESRNQQLGYQMFLAREAAGMTQAQLATVIGTRQANISRMEIGGYNFTVEMLEKIAKALKVNLKIELSSGMKTA